MRGVVRFAGMKNENQTNIFSNKIIHISRKSVESAVFIKTSSCGTIERIELI